MHSLTVNETDRLDLANLSDSHERLRGEFLKSPCTFREDTSQRKDFIRRVDEFLETARQHSMKSRSTAAADLICRIAADWQVIYTSELRIPKNIYEILKHGHSYNLQDTTLALASSPPLGRDAIFSRIQQRAYSISKDWKVSWLKRLLYTCNSCPERINELVLSPPRRSPDDDWREACAYFACEVLDANVDFALHMRVDGFEFLENVWLDDVKRLNAYLHWEATHPDGGLDDPTIHYNAACQYIHSRVMDPTIKNGAASFALIASWLQRNILDGGRLNTESRPYARLLVSRKAYRLWERTRQNDPTVNWRLAEQYARKFYENLIPAVVEKDQHAVESVLETTNILLRSRVNCEIMDAFEVAIIAFFFDPVQMEQYFNRNVTYV